MKAEVLVNEIDILLCSFLLWNKKEKEIIILTLQTIAFLYYFLLFSHWKLEHKRVKSLGIKRYKKK